MQLARAARGADYRYSITHELYLFEEEDEKVELGGLNEKTATLATAL